VPARTGEQFLRGLRDQREVWLGGERVTDPASHPALSGAAHAIAAVFDLQHERADVCLMPDPETGEPINVSHMIPRSRADLERRHACLQAIAEYSVGLMGRTPDYVNVTYAGFAGRDDEWSINGNDEGAANLVRYQKHMARADLSLTHAIIHPTVDRAQGAVPLGLTKWRSTKSPIPSMASSCAASACLPRWRRSPTRSRSTPRRRCQMRTQRMP
jgi:aromatic ring hydroxylase